MCNQLIFSNLIYSDLYWAESWKSSGLDFIQCLRYVQKSYSSVWLVDRSLVWSVDARQRISKWVLQQKQQQTPHTSQSMEVGFELKKVPKKYWKVKFAQKSTIFSLFQMSSAAAEAADLAHLPVNEGRFWIKKSQKSTKKSTQKSTQKCN